MGFRLGMDERMQSSSLISFPSNYTLTYFGYSGLNIFFKLISPISFYHV